MSKLILVSSSHAFTTFGLIAFYRDLADEIHRAGEKDGPVESGEISHWVTKLDTLNNVLVDSFDDLTDAMRESGHSAPFAWGTEVHRRES